MPHICIIRYCATYLSGNGIDLGIAFRLLGIDKQRMNHARDKKICDKMPDIIKPAKEYL